MRSPSRGVGEEKKGSEAGARAPELSGDGAINAEDGHYERGMVMASLPSKALGAGQKPGNSGQRYDFKPTFLHGVSAKSRDDRIHKAERRPGHLDPAFVPAAFERMRCDAAGASGKSDARPNLETRTLGNMGLGLLQKLKEVLPLRSQTTGMEQCRSLFPFPSSFEFFLELEPGLSEDELHWMSCLVLSLNSLWGSEISSAKAPNPGQKKCLRELCSVVKEFCGLTAPLVDLSWSDFFSVKGVDYKGDEVKVGRWFEWSNVSPALPGEIGKVPLEDVCSLGCKHYVLHFDDYLKPPSEWHLVRAPRVMVHDSSWGAVCSGLVKSGVCTWLEESEVFHVGDEPLLNGLFGVSKEEFTDQGVEIFRLIMNLIPLNSLCVPLSGDVDTLPSWGAMSPFFLQPSERLLVSSEDVKCFFYTMRVPLVWVKYLAFNKLVPNEVLPLHLQGKRVYIASLVLPMGFLNSVSLAQHVHRNLVTWSRERGPDLAGQQNAPEQELRKDRSFTVSDTPWRVYLDNYDLLEKVQATELSQVEGTVAPGVLALRHEYEHWEVPRNVKKAVVRSTRCEMQGATIDGNRGAAFPREVKLGKYFTLAMRLLSAEGGTQKQWQVVCGGLVYVSMFRRPLLGSLNAVWHHIERFRDSKQWLATPLDCRLEVFRFLGMFPLAFMNFRLEVHPTVTCSDASSSGGGICASVSTTAIGNLVSEGTLRGEVPDPRVDGGVLAIGLFDGIGALRVALELLGIPVLGYISVEKHGPARRVVESHYPGVVHHPDVKDISDHEVHLWAAQYSQACLVILGAGPPCQGVSGLNSDRRGALKDERSCLFAEVPRIRDLVKQRFKWCPVYVMMESVASMDQSDRDVMTAGIGVAPLRCDAGSLTWCHRPRLYWCDWEVTAAEGYQISHTSEGLKAVELEGWQDPAQVIRAGWVKVEPTKAFLTFTTARPRAKPGRKPAGVHQCSWDDLRRWETDMHRFPPYQYCKENCLVNKDNLLRLPDAAERELMLGFPLNYTANCLPKGKRKGQEYNDCRLTLLGNSWSVVVVSCLLNQLFGRLGFTAWRCPQDILDRCVPGGWPSAQGRLIRGALNPGRSGKDDASQALANKLANLISIKGEDILLSTPTSQMSKFHRLRASVPGKCWRWKIVAGWKWRRGGDHINSLELRAILTSLRWRIEHAGHLKTRFVHLTDSLVCLHALSRGRSSSRKLRRTMSRINALVLASGTHPLWGYIHTDQNPADNLPAGGGPSVPSSAMPKRKILEGAEASERARQRQTLGKLSDLTVQPATRKRYAKATKGFFNFLQAEGLTIPTKRDQFDLLVCDYLEHLWSTGIGRGQANDTVAGLQDLQPNLRHHLPGAWRLLKTWAINEVPNRAPPLPEQVVHAMAGWGFFHGHNSFATSLLLGFYTMLRSGELLSLKSSHILCAPADRQILISLGMTKGGKRQGAAESVILGVESGVCVTQHWKRLSTPNTPLAVSPSSWRSLFNLSLSALGLERFQFRPYSLRRGGATFWFQKHQNLDRILLQGRWLAHRTARIYINEGLAMLAKTQIDFKHPQIRSYLNIYQNTVTKPRFSTLEPPAKAGSAGGRGKKGKNKGSRAAKRVKKCIFRVPQGRPTNL